MRLLLAVIAAVGALIGLRSCSTAGCTENRNAVPLAQFLNSSDSKAIQLDSIQIYGIGAPGDSVLSPAGTKVSQVYLPMRPTAGNVSWCLAYKWKALDYESLYDTISFDYTSQPFFASDECGAYYRYHISSMTNTTHLIDSVVVVDSLITNVDKVYINIYFRVSADE